MCGLSGGNGYKVVKKSCSELGFKCKMKFGEFHPVGFIMSLGMSFREKCPKDKGAAVAVAVDKPGGAVAELRKIRAVDGDLAADEKEAKKEGASDQTNEKEAKKKEGASDQTNAKSPKKTYHRMVDPSKNLPSGACRDIDTGIFDDPEGSCASVGYEVPCITCHSEDEWYVKTEGVCTQKTTHCYFRAEDEKCVGSSQCKWK
eukprot:g1501.t1